MVGSFLYIFWCSEVLQGFKKNKQTKQTKPQQKAKQTENEIALKFSVIQCSEHSWDNLYPVHHPQKSSTNPLPRKNNKNKIKTKKNKTNKPPAIKFSLPTIALRSAMDCVNLALRCIPAPPPPTKKKHKQNKPNPNPLPPKKIKTKKQQQNKQQNKQSCVQIIFSAEVRWVVFTLRCVVLSLVLIMR